MSRNSPPRRIGTSRSATPAAANAGSCVSARYANGLETSKYTASAAPGATSGTRSGLGPTRRRLRVGIPAAEDRLDPRHPVLAPDQERLAPRPPRDPRRRAEDPQRQRLVGAAAQLVLDVGVVRPADRRADLVRRYACGSKRAGESPHPASRPRLAASTPRRSPRSPTATARAAARAARAAPAPSASGDPPASGTARRTRPPTAACRASCERPSRATGSPSARLPYPAPGTRLRATSAASRSPPAASARASMRGTRRGRRSQTRARARRAP